MSPPTTPFSLVEKASTGTVFGVVWAHARTPQVGGALEDVVFNAPEIPAGLLALETLKKALKGLLIGWTTDLLQPVD
jgi:hypothetical protein